MEQFTLNIDRDKLTILCPKCGTDFLRQDKITLAEIYRMKCPHCGYILQSKDTAEQENYHQITMEEFIEQNPFRSYNEI